MDDFDYFCGLAAGDVVAIRAPDQTPIVHADDRDPPMDCEFIVACGVLGSNARKNHARRSWQLTEHMRDRKKQKL